MRPIRTAATVAVAGAMALCVAAVAPAGATPDQPRTDHRAEPATRVYRANLNALNESGASGVARLRVKGDELDVTIDATGLVPDLVHAQHIHGVGNSECPPPSTDPDHDGVLSTSEGAPFYGPIAASLTTHGDTSPAAGLTIELMPVADSNGEIHYHRTFTLPHDVADNLGAFQIVQHGVDLNGNHAYDFEHGASELDSSLPQEATAPADCGTIDPLG